MSRHRLGKLQATYESDSLSLSNCRQRSCKRFTSASCTNQQSNAQICTVGSGIANSSTTPLPLNEHERPADWLSVINIVVQPSAPWRSLPTTPDANVCGVQQRHPLTMPSRCKFRPTASRTAGGCTVAGAPSSYTGSQCRPVTRSLAGSKVRCSSHQSRGAIQLAATWQAAPLVGILYCSTLRQ